MTVLLGGMFQHRHLRDLRSVFNARPVPAYAIVKSRCALLTGFILFPFYVAQVIPLLMVAPSWSALAVFTWAFWPVHIAVALLAALLAISSRNLGMYLIKLSFSAFVFAVYNLFFEDFHNRPAYWIRVPAKESVELLWQTGFLIVGILYVMLLIIRLHKGQRVGPKYMVGLAVYICVSIAAVRIPQFKQDFRSLGHPMPEAFLKKQDIHFSAERRGDVFYTQINRGPSNFGTWGQIKPPYMVTEDELYWFIPGNVTLKNLNPDWSCSARLVAATWISPTGDVLEYDPPFGYHMVRNHFYPLHDPPPTKHRRATLLGENEKSAPEDEHAGIYLFGAWTSDYAKFKTTPGTLTLQVRVDFYTHDLGYRQSIGEPLSPVRNQGIFNVDTVQRSSDAIEISMKALSPKYSWKPSDTDARAMLRSMYLYDPVTHEPVRSSRGHGGSRTFTPALWREHKNKTFLKSSMTDEDEKRVFDENHPLEFIWIKPRYLGTETVEIRIDDFALVLQEAIDVNL
ncbi:MAG: hypothetical protein PF795_00345 [Kiritimatiellae bacterium]|nr:hypothetical protein [Kiritimatiellia bacterium]